jgi:hypothetical protein
VGIGSCIAAVGIATALAGLESTGVFAVGIAGVVAAVLYYRLPDVVFDGDVAPKSIVTHEHEDGLSDEEYSRRLAIHSERNELQEEKREERRKKRERKANAGRTF